MKKIFIETSFTSFQDFHDGRWFERLFHFSDGLAIESAVEDFSTHWWGASRAFVLPWLLVDGVFKASRSGGGEIRDIQQLWNEYLEFDSFKGALWKTAESAYCSIYYAYENLLVNLLNTSKEARIRVTDRGFNSIVSKRLGESLASKIWNNSSLAVAKEVRNCLVHRGGKASKSLLKMKPLPKIEGEDIMISANDVRNLHGLLKPKVLMLVENYSSQKSEPSYKTKD